MGIFDTFKLGQKEFVNFMMALESGYRDIECQFVTNFIIEKHTVIYKRVLNLVKVFCFVKLLNIC